MPYSFCPIPGWRKKRDEKRDEKSQLETEERLALTLSMWQSVDLVKGHDVFDVQHYKERLGNIGERKSKWK